MNLTTSAPRSVSKTMLGVVQLGRATDIAKAVAHGQVGEYKFDSSMNGVLFEYLGIDPKEFLSSVKAAKEDSEIEAYLRPFVAKKDPRSIEAFNKKRLAEVPTGESLAHFNELRAKIAPARSDVTTWADLLDLEEGRTVPQRQIVHA